ncbi:kinetochore protein NDC80 homolog [Topomyia yanbarensis]|uniref:kinetochore protein NDC80 homolog n=1 Tax=Topomyia yanbarensis TaxID=2498891 RepID=UPI00273B6373|nr:kinetochore protein NDC80 homolog [Topomyia yanbarensis]
MSTNKQRTTMPRRTEEFDFSAPSSSVKKQPGQRLSRIAQPVRKLSKAGLAVPHGLNENSRSNSIDRLSALPNSAQITPATTRKTGLSTRSLNYTPASRTPLKSCENATSVPSTVERDKPPVENRDWLAAQCERICDYLVTVPGLPQDFIERRNLKAMSTKQFLVIVAYLFRQIGGSRYKLGTNFLEDIMKTMNELEYPYTISRSMLKTPNVPHSINNIIVMIGWLVQLAPQADRKVNSLKRDVHISEDFPTTEYQEFFFKKAEDGFGLWNLKKEDEFAAIVQELTDKLVAARTNGMTQQQVWKRIAELEQELQEINNQSIQQGREQSMDGINKAIQEQQQLGKKLNGELKCLLEEANKAEEDYYRNQEEFYVIMKKMEQLKQEIEAQQLSASERDELVHSIGANKNLLTAKRLAVSTLEHTCFEHQISVSRLIKQKFTLISTLNTRLHQFADSLKPMINYSAPLVDLKTENYTDLLADLHTIKSQLATVITEQSILYGSMNEEKSELEQKLSDLQIQHIAIEKSLQECTGRYEQLQKQREDIVQQLSSASVENSQASYRKQEDREQLDRKIADLQQQCEQNRKAIEKLNYDKQKLMVEKLEECQEVLNEKKRMQKEMTDMIEAMEAEIAGMERALDE